MNLKTFLLTVLCLSTYSLVNAKSDGAFVNSPGIGLHYKTPDQPMLPAAVTDNKPAFSFYYTEPEHNPTYNSRPFSIPQGPTKRTANTLMIVGGSVLAGGIALIAKGSKDSNYDHDKQDGSAGVYEILGGALVGIAGASVLLTGGIIRSVIAVREHRGDYYE